MTQTQPKVHIIDGKQYVEVDRNVRVDDLILIVDAEETYDMYNNGDILIVSGIADNGVYSESAEYHAPGSGNRDGFIADREFVVIEPVDSEEEEELVTATADNPDQIIELLGNIALRLTRLEERFNAQVNTIHFFESSTINVKRESDIATIAKELYEMQQSALKARGR